jgi:hypothetical protein
MILVTQIVHSVLMVIEYEIQNSYGSLIFSFIFVNIFLNVARNTFGRVLTLLVAMGTGITVPLQWNKRRTLIIILSVLYLISNVAFLVAVYINKQHPISPTIQLGVSFPLSLTNTLFFYWILKELGETQKQLEAKR